VLQKVYYDKAPSRGWTSNCLTIEHHYVYRRKTHSICTSAHANAISQPRLHVSKSRSGNIASKLKDTDNHWIGRLPLTFQVRSREKKKLYKFTCPVPRIHVNIT